MRRFAVGWIGLGIIMVSLVAQPVAAGEAPMQISRSYSGLLGMGVHGYVPGICWRTVDAGAHDEPEHRFVIPATIDGRKVTSTKFTVDFKEDQVGFVAVKIVAPKGGVVHHACYLDSAVIGSFPSGDYAVHVDLISGPVVAYSFTVTADLKFA